MKILYSILFLAFFTQINAQSTANGNFEFDIFGAEFVERTSIGLSFGINANWHERFKGGLNLLFAGNRNPNDFGYEINRTRYTAFGLTFTNTAHLFSIGRFSLDANANFGWLFLGLENRDEDVYDPFLDIYITQEEANETFRFLQGGLTANLLISQGKKADYYMYARVLRNQALGNVRFGGESGNSSFHFALGIRIAAF